MKINCLICSEAEAERLFSYLRRATGSYLRQRLSVDKYKWLCYVKIHDNSKSIQVSQVEEEMQFNLEPDPDLQLWNFTKNYFLLFCLILVWYKVACMQEGRDYHNEYKPYSDHSEIVKTKLNQQQISCWIDTFFLTLHMYHRYIIVRKYNKLIM